MQLLANLVHRILCFQRGDDCWNISFHLFAYRLELAAHVRADNILNFLLDEVLGQPLVNETFHGIGCKTAQRTCTTQLALR